MPTESASAAPGQASWNQLGSANRFGLAQGARRLQNRNRRTTVGSRDQRLQAGKVTVPLVVVLILVTLFLPEEVSFYLGPIRMTVVRLMLILTTPMVLARFRKYARSDDYRFVWNDAIVAILGVWMVVSVSLSEDTTRGMVFGGSTALEFCMPYFVARACLTKQGEALAAVKLLLFIMAVVGLLGLLDWAANKAILKETASQLTGYVKVYVNSRYDWRFGLLRAYSVSDHPIHLGIMSAFGLLLSRAYHGTSRAFIVAGCATGLVAAISSAAVGALVIGVALVMFDHAFRHIRAPMRLVPFGAMAMLVLLVFVESRSPWVTIFHQITFDPTTAYYRLMQWEFIWPVVMQSPWVGIGESLDFLKDELVPSVDCLWLRASMTFGVPGALLTFAAFFGSMSIPVKLGDRRLNLTMDENKLAHALGVVLFVGAFAATTVHFWNMIWMLTGFLAGVRAQLGNLAVLPRNENINPKQGKLS
jgi:hypothetical protein